MLVIRDRIEVRRRLQALHPGRSFCLDFSAVPFDVSGFGFVDVDEALRQFVVEQHCPCLIVSLRRPPTDVCRRAGAGGRGDAVVLVRMLASASSGGRLSPEVWV